MNVHRQALLAHATGPLFQQTLRHYIRDYLKADYRADLRRSGAQWRVFALQVWSGLNPDDTAKAVDSSADVQAYFLTLITRVKKAGLIAPIRVVQRRRHAARASRRLASKIRPEVRHASIV